MFITKTDKAIGMIVDQSGSKKVGVILTREVNDKPMCIDYFTPQWLAENTTNFDKYNSEYVFNVLAEHAKTIGASKEALTKLMLFAPDDVKKDLKKNAEAIYALYDEYITKISAKEKNMSTTKQKSSAKSSVSNTAAKEVKSAKSVKDDVTKAKTVKSAKPQVEKEAAPRKGKELFTADEIEAIRAVKKDEQLLGKNKSDTARRIVIKYHDTKTDEEMLNIARKIWTESNVQNNLIQWHHNELVEKGVIKA